MVAYIDTGSYVFVFLYRRGEVTKALTPFAPLRILEDAGVPVELRSEAMPTLQEVAAGRLLIDPVWLSVSGGEAFVECKLVPELQNEFVELQFGGSHELRDSLFAPSHYTPILRDKIVEAVTVLTSLPGFEIGFVLYLGKDHSEGHYRGWFAECWSDGWFLLRRFLDHPWLSKEALLLGPAYVERYGRGQLLTCPTWKAFATGDNRVCLFFTNLDPCLGFRDEVKVALVNKEPARQYLLALAGDP